MPRFLGKARARAIAPVAGRLQSRAAMRLAILGSVWLIGACGAGYRYEAAGRAAATIGAPAATEAAVEAAPASAAPGTGGVTARAGVQHDVVIHVSAPHAERVSWQLSCPGTRVGGVVGESLDEYRARRLGELRAERDRQRAAVSSLAGAIGGAVIGHAGAQAQVATPSGTATATAEVDGRAAGAVVGAAIVSDDVQLAPGDVGGGLYTDRVTVVPAGDGACMVAVWPDGGGDPSGLAGDFEVTRVISKDAEARARRAAIDGHAAEVRVSLRGQLVATGADPDARVHAHAEAEAHARVEAEVHARAQAELRERAWTARGAVIAWLTYCGGDPYKRAREREAAAELERARRAREDAEAARIRAQADAIAAANARRVQLALSVRQAEVALLIGMGAVLRPPMPPAQPEDPGAPPIAGEVWIPGHWEWEDAAWIWDAGYWIDDVITAQIGGSSDDGDSGGGSTAGDVRDHRHDSDSDSSGGGSSTSPPRDHRDAPPPPGATRDHRDASPSSSPSPGATRDHRNVPDEQPSGGARDHRDSSSSSNSSSAGSTRDHRH
jgi:hypothetical protein